MGPPRYCFSSMVLRSRLPLARLGTVAILEILGFSLGLGERQPVHAQSSLLPEDATVEKLDTEGNLYTTGPGGAWVYASSGTLLDRISVQEVPTNVAFGGSSYQTLYITARPNVYRLPVTVAGRE